MNMKWLKNWRKIMMIKDNDKIAGAIYDFIGYLTTRSGDNVFGRSHEVVVIHEFMLEWAKNRNLDIENPNIRNWNEEDIEYRQKYPELQQLYEKVVHVQREYDLLRKLLNE